MRTVAILTRTLFTVLSLLVLVRPAGAEVQITEVYYCHGPVDDQFEWIELFNASIEEIPLDGYRLAHGGLDYTWTVVEFGPDDVIPACGTFVVGGPESVIENAFPVLDKVQDLDQDLQNGGAVADAVALFAPGEPLTGIPLDAVFYGDANTTGLLGPEGVPGTPDVGNVPGYGISIARVAEDGTWAIELAPNPNALGYIPEICRPIEDDVQSWGALKATIRD